MKSYKNIGLLDLRRATFEEMKDIASIKNVGTVVVLEAQLSAVSNIKQTNVGSVIALPEGVKLNIQNGMYTLSRNILEAMNDSMLLVVNGKLKIEAIGDPSLLKKLYKVVVNGKVIVMEEDMGALSASLQVNGDSLVYRKDERVIEGTFVIEDDALYGVKPGTSILVESLEAVKPFDEALFSEAIANIRVNHSIAVRKNLIRVIAPKIENYMETPKTVVEEGYTYFDKLTIDETNYKSLQGEKLHVKGKLIVEVPVAKLKDKVTRIICNTLEINIDEIEAIGELVERAGKIKGLDPNVTENYSVMSISAEFLMGCEKLKLANYGALEMDETVTEALIEDKIERIENYGVFSFPKALHGAVMKKVKSNNGIMKGFDPNDKTNESDEENMDSEGGDERDYQSISNLGSFEY